MTKPNVTAEKMDKMLDFIDDLVAIAKRDRGFVYSTPAQSLHYAILFLITDYPRLKAKYDALSGKVEEWQAKAGLFTDPTQEKAYKQITWKEAIGFFLEEIRDFEEE